MSPRRTALSKPLSSQRMGEVAGQITDMLAGKDEGEGAFDLFRARRTQLALEGFVTAQETVGVIDPVAGLQILIVRGPGW